MSRGKHRALRIVLVLTGTLALAEGLSFGVGRFMQRKACMFREPQDPPGVKCPTYDEYMRRRDPDLGWPYPDQLGKDAHDAYGARPSPAFPDTTPETAQISLYGDSFTQSQNSGEEAWGNVLAQLSGCRVANYGQGGYGTDQAYLRYRRNTRDRAGVVILAHLSEDILRNLTRNRDLLISQRWLAYKPRFVLQPSGALELIPIPSLSYEDHLRLEGNALPPLELEHENFSPGGPAGATLLRFPFTLAVLRNFGDFRMRAKLAHRAYYAEFYERGGPMHGLEITREICRAFAAEASRRQQRALIMLFPTREDVVHFRAAGEWYYAPLTEELRAARLDTLDFGPALSAGTTGKSLDDVYDETGHFRPDTERLLAQFVKTALDERSLLESLRKR